MFILFWISVLLTRGWIKPLYMFAYDALDKNFCT